MKNFSQRYYFRKRIYTKHKITTSENDNILLPEKELNNKRRHSDTDSPYLPPKYSSKNSTFQSPQKTHPTNVNDINSQDYDPIMSNVIAVPESPAKVFIKYRTISIKYNLQSNISILSSIADGFFNIVTSEMVTDLNNTGKRKRIYTKHKITTITTPIGEKR